MNLSLRIRLLVAAAPLVFFTRMSEAQAAPQRVDLATGAVWVMLPNLANPAAPARWVLGDAGGLHGNAVKHAEEKQPLVIHSGDRIVLEEHTPATDARLDATALMSAAKGGVLRVRIRFSGQIVSARALTAGSAEEVADTLPENVEAWR